MTTAAQLQQQSTQAAPLGRALVSQLCGLIVAGLLDGFWVLAVGSEATTTQWIAAQAIAAAATASALRMNWWWLGLQLGFTPALALGIALSLPPQWSAVLFGTLLLVYGGTLRTRVPLYLSSAGAVRALAEVIAPSQPARVLDLGCGTGTVLSALARSRPLAALDGVERAPLPWLIAKLRSRVAGCGYRVRWGNLWTIDLSGYDVVYAYLSPVPMPRLWEKARREMRPGALLVSFRFCVPGVAPERTVLVGNTGLYIWRM